MEARKVQLTGGSTYTISLPKRWVGDELNPGDNVYLQEEGDDIRLSTSSEAQNVQQAVMDSPENVELAKRRLAGIYLNGVEKIVISNIEGGRDKLESFIRDSLVGMEITKIEEKKIEARNLFDSSNLSAKNGLRRMDSTIYTMMDDIVEFPEKVEEMDDVLDKYYLLLLRQIVLSRKNPDIKEQMDLNQDLKAMDFRLVAKSLERVGDHLVEISADEKEVREQVSEFKELYKELSASLFESDLQKAEDIIEKLESKGEEENYHVERIRRLLLDVSNAVINFSIMDSEAVKTGTDDI